MTESVCRRSRARTAALAMLVLAVLVGAAGVNLSNANGADHQIPLSEHPHDPVASPSAAVKLPSFSVSTAAFPPRSADAFYPAGQDPMGLADYGQAHYDTKSFLASVSIASLSTLGSGSVGSDMTFQLNVNLGFEDGGNWYVYWIQDVAELDTSNNYIYFIDNVWNSSGPSGSVYSSTLAGNGQFGTYSGQQYYYDVASGSLQGNGVYLTYPSTFDMIANTTINGNGQPVVDFTYQNGGSWITYDRVTFSFVSQLDYSDNFLVTSATPNPAGLGYDAEIVLGGPGGGSNANDQSSNVQLTLQYWNGNNYQMIQNGENHGEDTGETITNAEVNGYY
jgi:Thermopsin